MRIELKKAILDWMIENINQFQLVNDTHTKFNDYIYDKGGNYLIGGKAVSTFIIKAAELLKQEI